MVFDHVVKYNGIFYESGQNVPIDEDNGVSTKDTPIFDNKDAKHIYTKDELLEMSVKEIKKIAEENGFTIKKISPKESVIEEFLENQ